MMPNNLLTNISNGTSIQHQWTYYNHSILPTTSPHFEVDDSVFKKGLIWKNKDIKNSKKAILARWTSNFDCGYVTNWWHIIKDDTFDITKLKAKNRYVINKGIKFFSTLRINPLEYKEELCQIQEESFKAYPITYRPTFNKEEFINSLEKICKDTTNFYGAFHKESGQLAAYAIFINKDNYTSFSSLKSIPSFEQFEVNAAIIAGALNDYKERLLGGGYYICDGERSISHITKFQDYLEKYFGFRKAYCKLNVNYRGAYKFIVNILYPFKSILKKMDKFSIFHSINGVLDMEKIVRCQKPTNKKQMG